MSSTSTLRRFVHAPAPIAVALCITLWGATAFALSGAPASRIDLASRRGPSYARDSGRFRPVTLGLLGELLGEAPVDGLVPPLDTAPTSRSPLFDDPAGEPPPDASQPTPRAELLAFLEADRASAAPGDQITYTIRVRNVGEVEAINIALESHVPSGTTLVTGTDCQGESVAVTPPGQSEPSPRDDKDVVCVDVGPVFSPDVPGEHDILYVISHLAKGESDSRSFVVRVDRTGTRGATIYNHGHVHADNHPLPINTNVVEVQIT